MMKPGNQIYKAEYLKLREVSQFSEWLQAHFSDDQNSTFSHSYQMEKKGRTKSTKFWSCESLIDAKAKYVWPFSYLDLSSDAKVQGQTFTESETTLNRLAISLRTSVRDNNIQGTYEACHMILDWGGVLGGPTRGNKKHLNTLRTSLPAYLRAIKDYFESPSAALQKSYIVDVDVITMPVLMNSGFTKIYALLCGDFVIYDGRVGAALGLLVRKFLEEEGQPLTESLSFAYGPARTAHVNRNPSASGYNFPQLQNNVRRHIQNNLKANWLLCSTIDKNPGLFSNESNPLRSLEAALFMIGYRV